MTVDIVNTKTPEDTLVPGPCTIALNVVEIK